MTTVDDQPKLIALKSRKSVDQLEVERATLDYFKEVADFIEADDFVELVMVVRKRDGDTRQYLSGNSDESMQSRYAMYGLVMDAAHTYRDLSFNTTEYPTDV